MFNDQHEKTEQPTARRLADARLKGHVAKSQDLVGAILLLASLLILLFFLPKMYDQLCLWCIYLLQHINSDITQLDFIAYAMESGTSEFLFLLLPLLLGAILFAILGNVFQIGFLISTDPLLPRWSRLNIFDPQNYKRVMSLPAITRVAVNMVRLGIVFLISWGVTSFVLPDVYAVSRADIHNIIPFLYYSLILMGILISLFFLVMGVFDYLYQRIIYRRNWRMSKREVQEERKEAEMDDTIKYKMGAVQKLWSQGDMQKAVKSASVVVVDGENLAIAIGYQAEKMQVPICQAKGAYERAMSMMAIAKKHQIPIVENKYFTQALYKEIDQNRPIPSVYYVQVAHILVQAEAHGNK